MINGVSLLCLGIFKTKENALVQPCGSSELCKRLVVLGRRDLGGGYGGIYSLVFPVHGKPKTLCYFLLPSNPGLLNIEESVGIDLLWFCVYGLFGLPMTSPQNKIFLFFVCWKFIFVFGKSKSGKFFPFMAIPNFKFNNCI